MSSNASVCEIEKVLTSFQSACFTCAEAFEVDESLRQLFAAVHKQDAIAAELAPALERLQEVWRQSELKPPTAYGTRQYELLIPRLLELLNNASMREEIAHLALSMLWSLSAQRSYKTPMVRSAKSHCFKSAAVCSSS
jgi:hypothetical protein